MTTYHAVLLDECREEFGVTVKARTKAHAREKLREDYPECRCVQLETPHDTLMRERRMYRQIEREYERGY